MTTTLTEEILLLTELKLGKKEAFRQLFIQYRYWMFLQALSHLNDEHAAQDLVHELLADFWQYKLYENINTTLKGYLVSAIRNRSKNYIRSVIREERRIRDLPVQEYLIPDMDLEKDDLMDRLEKAIQQLPPKMHQVFKYFFQDGLSHKQIADLTGNSRHTISNQIDSAKKFLKKKLKNT